MKKMTFKSRLFGGFVGVAAALFAVSCAQGFDDNETWRSDVTGAQLESPALTEANFSTRVNPDGSESVQVSWKVVPGASGYECYVAIVDDPENPVVLIDEVLDRCSIVFDRLEDTKYTVSVRTIGDAKKDNSDAASASVYDYSTLVPAQKVPAGADIAAFVKENLIMDATQEQAFELEPGATYTVSEPIDFKTKAVTFRGDKVHRPVVRFENIGCIMTAGALKVKFINFDCSDSDTQACKYVYGSSKETSRYWGGVIVLGDDDFYPDYKSQNFGPKTDQGYVMPEPIIVQDCNFKNVRKAFIFGGYNAWVVKDFRINDCIIQLATIDEDSDRNNFISFSSNCGGYEGKFGSKWNGGVQNVSIRNSTIYNTRDPQKKVRFMRFSNKNVLKNVLGSNVGSFTLTNCTLYKTFANCEFANNTPSDKGFVLKVTNNVFYDCARLNKLNFGGCTIDGAMNNTGWIATPNGNEGGEMLSGSDLSNGIVVEEDPGFVTPTELDLTDDEKGGQNFKATGVISSTIGDPRWK